MARIHRARRRALLYGLILFVVLFTIAASVAVPAMESDIRDRSERALADAGFQNASVRVDGRRVTVDGARSEADATQMQAVVSRVRGVARARASLPEGETIDTSVPADQPALEASFEANTLTVRGQVPRPELKDGVLAAAGTAVGADRVVDAIVVRNADRPADGAVTDVAAFGELLTKLPTVLLSGIVSLSERNIEVAGLLHSNGSRRNIDDLLQAAQSAAPGLAVTNSVRNPDGTTGNSAAPATTSTVPPPPAHFTAEWANGKLTLTGSVATAAQHQFLHDGAARAFGADVVDQLTVPVANALADPKTDAQLAAVTDLIAASKPALAFGKVAVAGTAVAIDAFATDAAAKAALDAVAAKLPTTGLTVSGAFGAPAGPGGKDLVTQYLEDQLNQLVATNPIVFASASAEIVVSSNPTLDQAANLLRGIAGVTVTVGGHTDNTGDAALNQSLSQRRADAVRAALVARGTPEGLLVAVGYGDTQPKADNATEAGRQENRRVQFDVRRSAG